MSTIKKESLSARTGWKYVFEGGMHAVFKYSSGERKGKLLRVRKEDLTKSAISSNSDYVLFFILYIHKVVFPRLKPYADVPDTVELTLDQVAELHKEALSSGKIPELRRDNWKVTNDSTDPVLYILASVSSDYRQISGYENQGWSIEIKPKAGFMTFSPIVDPKHRVKYELTKFAIQQALIARNIIQKGWMRTSVITHSCSYDPLGFFSGEEPRIASALAALFGNPQNFLKVWNKEGDIAHSNLVMNKLVEEEKSFLNQSLACILHSENVLSKLLQMQLLDVIDADGAVLVYNRLVELCNGERFEAEYLVDNVDGDIASEPLQFGCLKSSPFQRPNCEALDRLLSEVDNFSDPTSKEQSELDSIYHKSAAIVNKLSKPACIFLLKNWLLSLAMCDVGILIALTPIDQPNATTTTTTTGVALKTLQLQGAVTPGMIECNGNKW
eukprot:CAMPEP_0194425720 /NCGR_PEP_ID=MMETSP0176-20130528/24916_1 /TAXON_ID=216777 /ORGANISM="Proboscia alata, Strain PI-D3" /LENGTH=441 /DNA_ID=CAMNT_0039236107 /DNA_START=359 /DNA_END=1681 /DNA_ORIENTATION=-